jgi:dTDP-4-dehydrorhamnose 3,5-epimerase
MRFLETRIDGVWIIEPERHTDSRGTFCRTFCESEFAGAGIPFKVVQVNHSFNPAKHTLRGLHYQVSPYGEPKLVSCLRGRIFDVAVDLRPDSPTFRNWLSIELGPAAGRMLFISAGLAHGFLTLEAETEVMYLMGAPHVPDAARGLRWDDPALGIGWPAAPELISNRDASYPLLEGME